MERCTSKVVNNVSSGCAATVKQAQQTTETRIFGKITGGEGGGLGWVAKRRMLRYMNGRGLPKSQD